MLRFWMAGILVILALLSFWQALEKAHAPTISGQAADITFELKYDPLLSVNGCRQVTWAVQGDAQISLNTSVQPASGTTELCAARADKLRLDLPERQSLVLGSAGIWRFIQTPLWIALAGIISAIFIAGQPAQWLALLTGGVLCAGWGLWWQAGLPALPLISSEAIPQLSPGIGSLIFVAGVAAMMYWLVVPRQARRWFLALFSLMMLILNGASPAFILLVIVLIVLTHSSSIEVMPSADTGKSASRMAYFSAAGLIILAVVLLVFATSSWVLTALLPVLIPAGMITAGVLTGWFIMREYRSASAWIGRTKRVRFSFPALIETQPGWQWGLRLLAAGLTAGLVVIYLEALLSLLAFHWPEIVLIAVTVLLMGAAASLIRQAGDDRLRRWPRRLTILLIVVAFIQLKITAGLVGWFGFSYLAFRLLHILLDRLNGVSYQATYPELLAYTLFFPAQPVGPIDTLPRFLEDTRIVPAAPPVPLLVQGVLRMLMGGVKKFLLADVLLSHFIPGTVPFDLLTPGYAWLQLYCYALFLYCDFSGFVDIAIGTGNLLGYQLPENFNNPYFKGSLARFWQSWHITLSGWLRMYVFLPLNRRLLKTRLRRFPVFIAFIGQMTTMLLIGLWHGFTWNFLLWGLWHGTGLFIHKVFSDRTRPMQLRWKGTLPARVFAMFSILLTFHFVLVGWVFFALPDPQSSLMLLRRMTGIAP